MLFCCSILNFIIAALTEKMKLRAASTKISSSITPLPACRTERNPALKANSQKTPSMAFWCADERVPFHFRQDYELFKV
jgi:hypothetical protein